MHTFKPEGKIVHYVTRLETYHFIAKPKALTELDDTRVKQNVK